MFGMNSLRGILWVLPVLMIVGCNGAKDETTEVELPDWLNSSDGETSGDSSTPRFGTSDSATLSLNLKPGDRFPLKKVVEQRLVQSSLNGAPVESRSRLELMFAISVLDVQDERTKLNVRYERVNYTHDVAGDHQEYDSTRPPLDLPVTVRAYHDMVDDGFSFWLGKNNQIVEVEGFTDFLNRCLKNVPEAQRQQVIFGIEAGSGEEGIANFVDNSIGLLPFDQEQTVGATWYKSRNVQRPVPMTMNSTYTLKEVTDQHAVIDVQGAITPSTGLSEVSAGNGVRITVTGGDASGRCTIFRDTGLPLQSQITRTVDMNVMTGAIQFKQQKQVTTTIESFPVSSGAPTMLGGAPASSGISPTASNEPLTLPSL